MQLSSALCKEAHCFPLRSGTSAGIKKLILFKTQGKAACMLLIWAAKGYLGPSSELKNSDVPLLYVNTQMRRRFFW